MPTVVTKTLDSTGSGDYTTFSAWQSFVSSDLVTADEQHILECVDTGAYFDLGTGTLDFYGTTTDATRNIIIRAQTGSETNLTKGSGFQFYASDAYRDHILEGSTEYMTFENIECVTINASQVIKPYRNTTFTNCYFESDNMVIASTSGSIDNTFTNCKFIQSSSVGWGVKLFDTYTNSARLHTFTDCDFVSESQGEQNATLMNLNKAYDFTFTRCTFTTNNSAYAVTISNTSDAGYLRFHACSFKSTYTGGSSKGISIDNSISAALQIDIFNCNVGGFATSQISQGSNSGNTTVTVKNTISVGALEYHKDYSSDGYDSNSTNNTGVTTALAEIPGTNALVGDLGNDFYDAMAGDLRLIAGSAMLGSGVDLTATIPSDVNSITYTVPMNRGALQTTSALTATELKYTVKADGTGDYTTLSGALSAAKTANSGNNVSADKYVTIECYDQGSAITDSVDISGWTTAFRTDITIIAATGSETSFTSGSGFGITSSAGTVFKINVKNVKVRNIEIIGTSTTDTDHCVRIGNNWPEVGHEFELDSCLVISAGAKTVRLDSGAYNAVVKDCTIKNTSTSAAQYTLRTNAWNNNEKMTIQDCTVESASTDITHSNAQLAGSDTSDIQLVRCTLKATAGARGLRLTSPCNVSSTVVIGNSTPVTGSVGIVRKGGAPNRARVYNVVVSGFDIGATNDTTNVVRFRNSVIYNCNTSWASPTSTSYWDVSQSKYNASDDASASDILGSDSVTGIASSDFNDTSTDDYRLASTGSALEDAGWDVSGWTQASATGLAGVSWTTPYNIGAYEGVFSSGGGGTTHSGTASHAIVFSMDEDATVVSGGTTHSGTASLILAFTNDEDCSNTNSATSAQAIEFTNEEDCSNTNSATSAQALAFTNDEDCSNTNSAISSQAIEFTNTSIVSNSTSATASSSLTFANTENTSVVNSAVSSIGIVFSSDEDASIVHRASASHAVVSTSEEDLGVRHYASSSQVLAFTNDEDIGVLKSASASASTVFSADEDASVTQSASSSADVVFSCTTTARNYTDTTVQQSVVFSNEEDASTLHLASASHEVITTTEEDLGVRHYASSTQVLAFTNIDVPSVTRSTTTTADLVFSNISSTLISLNATSSSDLVFSCTATPRTIVEGNATFDLVFTNEEDCSNNITLSTPIDYVWTDELTWVDWLSWDGLDQLNHSLITADDEDASVQHIASCSSELTFSANEDCSVKHNAVNSNAVVFTNDEDAHVLHKATATHSVITTADEDAHVLHKATATINIVFSNRLDEYYVDHQAIASQSLVFSNEEDASILHLATASHNVITSNVVDSDMLAVIPHNTVIISQESRTIVINQESRTISINELI
jgi:hypothetical protein